MTAEKTIVTADKTEAMVNLILQDVAIPVKLIPTYVSLCRFWKDGSIIDNDFKNLVCDDLESMGKNRHMLLNRSIHQLMDVHVTLNKISAPLIIPTKYLRMNGIRKLNLHPEVERLLKNKDLVKELKLVVNYTWKS